MSNQLVSEHEAEESLNWLAANDYELAAAQANKEKQEKLREVTVAELSKISDKKSQQAKEADAISTPQYKKFLDDQEQANRHYYGLKLKAAYHNTRIDVWRTLQANQRRGQV